MKQKKPNKQVKVKGHDSFTKNPVKGTIVNVNNRDYRSRLNKIVSTKRHNERIKSLEDQVAELTTLLKQSLGQ